MTPEIVVDAHARLGEGPVWDDQAEILYWVDILGKQVHAYGSGGDRVFDVGVHVGALALRRSGGLVLAATDGFRLLDTETGTQAALSTVEHPGPEARFNDGGCDPSGAFWVGTMAYDTTPGAGILYRLDPSGAATPVLRNVTVSNGLEFTPDGSTLYYIDTPTQRIDAFDCSGSALAKRRTVVEIDEAAGSPDGMTMDADGCLWVALWDGSAVHRYTPAGVLDRVVEFPVRRPTSVAFGGADLGTLFVTSASVGTDDPHGGALFAVDVNVKGRAAHRYAG